LKLEQHGFDIKEKAINSHLMCNLVSKYPLHLQEKWEEEVRRREDLEVDDSIEPEEKESCLPITLRPSVEQFLKFIHNKLASDAKAAFNFKDATAHERKPGGQKAGAQSQPTPSAGKPGQGGQQQSAQKQSSVQQFSTMGGGGGPSVSASAAAGERTKSEKKADYNARKSDRKLWAFIQAVEDPTVDDDTVMALAGGAGGRGGASAAAKQGGQPAPQQGGSGGGTTPVVRHQAPNVGQKQQSPATGATFKTGCLWCGANHDLKTCAKVKDLPVKERWNRVRARMRAGEIMCVACFGVGHKSTECDKGCKVKGCQRRHNTLLHSDPPPAAGQ
jgi:hypothetical protein